MTHTKITPEEAKNRLALNLVAVLDFGPEQAAAQAKEKGIPFDWETALSSVAMILGQDVANEARSYWSGEADDQLRARFEAARQQRREALSRK